MSLKTESNLSGPVLAKLRSLAGENTAARKATGDAVAQVAAGWVGTQYLLSVSSELAEKPDGPERFKLLRQAAGDVVSFQRGGVWAARVELDREKLEFQRLKHKDRFKVQGLRSERGKRGARRPLTEEELKACVEQVDEIMGLRVAQNR